MARRVGIAQLASQKCNATAFLDSTGAMALASHVATEFFESLSPVVEQLHAMGVAAWKESPCWRRLSDGDSRLARFRHDATYDLLLEQTLEPKVSYHKLRMGVHESDDW